MFFEARLGAGIGHSVSLSALALIGLFIGYIAGMFGVGGGFLLTPILMYVFDVPPAVAVGSALCQKCGTSIASFLKFRQLKRGEPRIDYVMIAPSLIGIHFGTMLLASLSRSMPWTLPSGKTVPAIDVVLDILFFVMLGLIGVFSFYESWQARHHPVERGDLTIPGPLITKVRIPPYIELPHVGLKSVSVPMLVVIGFILGLASGLMGIGGGVLFMPVLLYGFGFSARNAAGTGVLLLFVTVAAGTIEQALHGFVAIKLSMVILVGSSVGSQLGALTTHYLPNRQLRLIFSILVLLTTAMIVWDLVGIVTMQFMFPIIHIGPIVILAFFLMMTLAALSATLYLYWLAP